MVRKDGAEARKERIATIARTIQANLHKKKEVLLKMKNQNGKLRVTDD